MSMYIYFSNNSVGNTTISCESMGIHYIVTKPARILSLSRWDPSVNAYVKAGQFERSDFAWKHWVRLGQDGQWQMLKNWLHKGDAGITSDSLTFTGNNGVQYRWKTRKNVMMMINHSTHPIQEPLVVYHENQEANGLPFLEIRDQSVMNGLDNIILAFLICEGQRRNSSGSR